MRYYGDTFAAEPSFDYPVPTDGERALESIMAGRVTGRVVRDVVTRAEIEEQPRADRSSDGAVRLLRRYRYYLGDREGTTMLTARGCPEQCTFCEEAMTSVRRSSLSNLRGEISDIAALGYRGVHIFDDLFALSLNIIRRICSILREYDLIYRCNVQARYFTSRGNEMDRMLADSGCYEIAFGAESGSQKILDNVRKRCTVKQNFKAVEYAKRLAIKVKAFILLGLPGEDHETLREIEAFVRDAACDDYEFAVYMPLRGTAIRDAIDRCDPNTDLAIVPAGSDAEVTGAYGTKGGRTAYEVRTEALSETELREFRDYLVAKYKPISHRARWADQEHFFDQAFAPVWVPPSGQTLFPVMPDTVTQPVAPTADLKTVERAGPAGAWSIPMRPDGYSFCVLAGGRRPKKLARLIESIHAQDLPQYEVIVAGSVEVEGLEYIALPHHAAAGLTCHLRNAAARRSTLEWIVFADDDIVLRPGWCMTLCNHRSPGDMVGTRLLNLDGTRHWDWASTGGPRGQILLDYGEVDPDHYLTGGLLVVRAAVWEAVRWDERLRYRKAEDVVFCRDASKRGFTSSFCGELVAIHNDETYTQIGRQVPRRSAEGARVWLAGSLLSAPVDALLVRSEEEKQRKRIPEAADCIRYAIHKSPGCAEARERLTAVELAYGGPVDSGSWQPVPVI